MASFSAIGDYFAGLVHPSVVDDEVASARHYTFIISHIAAGVLAFAAFPLILLARGGVPSIFEIAVLAWLVAPIFTALELSRTGNLARAHFISTTSLAGLIFTVAAMSGGINSFAMIWLPIIVFEAAFSGSRHVIVASFGVALLVVTLLLAMDTVGLIPRFPKAVPSLLPEFTALIAVIYTAGLALRWDSIQKKLLEIRHKNEDRYRLLAENASDLVTRHTAGGAVTFASPAAQHVLGTSASELQGRGLFERVHVADRPAYLTAISEAARGTTSKVEFRIRKTTTDDLSSPPRHVWVEMQCRSDNSGQVIAMTREIADRRERRMIVDQARVKAEDTHAAKGTFLASMSHELRTPLNAIIGFSELLASEEFAASDERRRQEYAGLIHDSGLHLLAVVNGILDMSRIESGNFSIVSEPFNVRPVIDSCIQLFALKAENASVRLKADIHDNLPELMADKRACKQILINLLSNAIKFTPAGGEVVISVHEEPATLRVEVSDTGVGIAAEDIPNLGNSFFQARSAYDRPYEGAGLGLSIVKGLIDLHRGSLEVKSELGRGTNIIVRLPRDRGTPESMNVQSPSLPERRAANG